MFRIRDTIECSDIQKKCSLLCPKKLSQVNGCDCVYSGVTDDMISLALESGDFIDTKNQCIASKCKDMGSILGLDIQTINLDSK